MTCGGAHTSLALFSATSLVQINSDHYHQQCVVAFSLIAAGILPPRQLLQALKVYTSICFQKDG